MKIKDLLLCIFAAGLTLAASAQDLKPVRDKETKKYGYQNKARQWVVEPTFDGAKRFVDGYAEVTVGEYIGLIDSNCDWVFPAEFSHIGKFHKSGLCELMRKEDREKIYGVGDRSGRIVVPMDCYDVNIPRSAGYITAKRDVREGELIGMVAWGVYEPDGREVFAPQFDEAPSFRDGVAVTRWSGNGRAGVINEAGQVLLPFEYLAAERAGSEFRTLDLHFTQSRLDADLNRLQSVTLPGVVAPYDPQGDPIRAAAWHSGCIGRRMHRNNAKLTQMQLLGTGVARLSDIQIDWGRRRFLRLEPCQVDESVTGAMEDPYSGQRYTLKALLYEENGTLVGEASSWGWIEAECDEGAVYCAEGNQYWLMLNDINTLGHDRINLQLTNYRELNHSTIFGGLGLSERDLECCNDPRGYADRVTTIVEGDNIGLTSYLEPETPYFRDPVARSLMRTPLFRYPYRMGEVVNCDVHEWFDEVKVDLYQNLVLDFEDELTNPTYRMRGEEEIYWGPNNARTVCLSVEPVLSSFATEDDLFDSGHHYRFVLSLYEEDGTWLRRLATADYIDYAQDGVIVFERLGIALVAPDILRHPERSGLHFEWGDVFNRESARGELIRTITLPGAKSLPRTLSALEQATKPSFNESRYSGRRGWDY
ncbi:MAG: WG repeat-containing protein [Bacteroidales bacterium]|nr:WG repeat-containing protein [Bacteroidales bacterium]